MAFPDNAQPAKPVPNPGPGRQRRPLPWRAGVLAVVVFCLLQWAWGQARGTWAERLVIHDWTVGTAVAAIGLITPELQATGSQSRIQAAGGGINILNGCEGTEVLFLLVAALLVTPGRWRARWLGLLAGAVLVFSLNQLRVLALFYSFRHDRALFDLLHTLVAPLGMVAGTLVFYVAWLEWQRRTTVPAQVA